MLGKILLIISMPLIFSHLSVHGLEENSPDEANTNETLTTSPDSNSTDDGGINMNNIDQIVRLFFYRKNKRKSSNWAVFELQGREVAQARVSDHFDRNLNTKFIIHGWLNNKNSLQFQQIKEAYHAVSDQNIFIVDWSGISEDINYMRVANFTRLVGMYVAEKIQELIETSQADVSRFHIIGHSLGAHIAGFAGAQIKSPKIRRITALDPALPNFQRFKDPDLRLDASDADFVDVIHTSGGTLGAYAPIGSADFYVNGGTPPQPGCSGVAELATICSHGRAVEYFLESIATPVGFWGLQCDSWAAYKASECRGSFTEMGDRTNPTARGTFYLGTNSMSPFAMGRKVFFENEPFWRTTLNTIIHQTSSFRRPKQPIFAP
ncbi:phospholipase A1-like [Lutzomyia longipalpis]|uniref:phospholipase A1-like n=1 Tax=Lutzomyia longipalpis TaxID=7200 RepID=UPI0024845A31|nr:phospholipase A1-like [Lutzomyia longipalpis]